MKKVLLLILPALLLAACSGNRADQQNDSTGNSMVPREADSAVKANSKPVDTAGKKDTTHLRDSVKK